MKIRKKNRIFMSVMLLGGILILLGILSGIQINQNRKQVSQTTTILLDQVCQIIDSNQTKEKVLVESLQEDYITRAMAVSYIIDCKPEIEHNIEELLTIASMLKVDEVHILNQNGVIYGGTEPQYYGYSFDSSAQMSYFKPMLTDKTMSMCQDLTPNTTEGKVMMYAICWDEMGSRMLQVGIEPKRLMEELRVSSVRETMQEMPAYPGITMAVADENTGEIQGATAAQLVGKTLEEIGIDLEEGKLEQMLEGSVDGKQSYYKLLSHHEHVIAVIQEKSVVHKDVPLILGIVAIYFAIAVSVALVFILRMAGYRDSALRNAKTDALTGLLNRRGYDDSMLARGGAPLKDTFVYVSMDLNGLKQANDSFGHEAGDKLLKGAAACMRKCLGEYGELFRLGGDEFVAMLEVDDQQLELLKQKFEETIDYWSIHLVKGLSVSCGYVQHKEFPEKTLEELIKIADIRMYQAKQKYYETTGVNRRRG